MGLLDIDFNDPETAGLLGAAGGLFAAGAPSRQRISTGQAIMMGLQGMQQGQQGARDYAINQELLRRKKAAEDLNMEMNQFKFGQEKQSVADQKLAHDTMIKYAKMRQANIGQPQLQTQMQSPSSVQGYSMPNEQSQNNRVNGMFSTTVQQNQQQPMQQPQPMQRGKGSAIQAQIDDLINQANFYDAEGVPSDELRKQVIEMTKTLPKVKEWKEITSGDKVLYAPYFEDGSAGDAVPYEIAAKLHFGDNGQQLIGQNAYTGKVVSTNQKQQSLESLASDATARRGQNMIASRADQRLKFDMNGGTDGGASQMGLNKQFGKPQAGYRWTPDGSLEFIPGGPADQKAQMKSSGEGTVDSVVADLRDKYDKLNSGGGMVNDKEGMIGNIGARIASTGFGQTLGGAVGTTNQTSRDSIAMTRPLLLQSIMKATGMSAKQMDSNVELKLYLATATDPTKGYQANMEALQRIEDLYGGGQKGAKPADAKPVDKPAANLMQKLPTANASNKGRKIRDTSTGEVLVSNGLAWVKE